MDNNISFNKYIKNNVSNIRDKSSLKIFLLSKLILNFLHRIKSLVMMKHKFHFYKKNCPQLEG